MLTQMNFVLAGTGHCLRFRGGVAGWVIRTERGKAVLNYSQNGEGAPPPLVLAMATLLALEEKKHWH